MIHLITFDNTELSDKLWYFSGVSDEQMRIAKYTLPLFNLLWNKKYLY